MNQSVFENLDIDQQRDRVFGQQPDLNLISPCKLGEGVISCQEDQKELLIDKFDNTNVNATFFVPASGSGSRMFQFLYEFLEEPNDDNTSQVERFFNHIEDFSFFNKLPLSVRKKLQKQDVNLDEFVRYLLTDQGMGYGDLPKGLIPFHNIGPFVLCPYQEQLLQGLTVKESNLKFHFTIKPSFEKLIDKNISAVKEFIGHELDVEYSCQNSNSDAIAFNTAKETLLSDDGEILTRPSGHGALLQNLNAIKSDLIFIKNIDNIQHYTQSELTTETWRFLGGMALWFQEKVFKLIKNPSLDGLIKLNNRFQFLDKKIVENLSDEDIVEILNRPFRVCGMVKNEGQAGGGPFWVEENGTVSKQIVEKSQIKMRGQQYRLMIQSTHFNPVFIVAATKDVSGNSFDLNEFSDPSKFFIVKKKYKGQDIFFSELPGLWNGSMAKWNSIFVDIPSQSFSPVKTVLDLLGAAHKDR